MLSVNEIKTEPPMEEDIVSSSSNIFQSDIKYEHNFPNEVNVNPENSNRNILVSEFASAEAQDNLSVHGNNYCPKQVDNATLKIKLEECGEHFNPHVVVKTEPAEQIGDDKTTSRFVTAPEQVSNIYNCVDTNVSIKKPPSLQSCSFPRQNLFQKSFSRKQKPDEGNDTCMTTFGLITEQVSIIDNSLNTIVPIKMPSSINSSCAVQPKNDKRSIYPTAIFINSSSQNPGTTPTCSMKTRNRDVPQPEIGYKAAGIPPPNFTVGNRNTAINNNIKKNGMAQPRIVQKTLGIFKKNLTVENGNATLNNKRRKRDITQSAIVINKAIGALQINLIAENRISGCDKNKNGKSDMASFENGDKATEISPKTISGKNGDTTTLSGKIDMTQCASVNKANGKRLIQDYETWKKQHFNLKTGLTCDPENLQVYNYDLKGPDSIVNSCKRRRDSRKPVLHCTFCDYTCSYKGRLILHLRTHTGEKPFQCTMCDYRCSDKVYLNRHLRIHTGEKPFQCTMCDYKSTQKNGLVSHMRTHSKHKPFQCTVCDYKCSKNRNLTLHLKSHHNVKPFLCSLCDYSCKNINILSKHMKTHNDTSSPIQN